jgi:RNA recognition motif-containing protein
LNLLARILVKYPLGTDTRGNQTGSIKLLKFLKEKMEEVKNKLYVGNLPYGVDDDKLKEIFAAIGEVTEAKVIADKFSGRSKGFGFVTMKDDAIAEKAVKELDGKEIEGRNLKVNVARPMRER